METILAFLRKWAEIIFAECISLAYIPEGAQRKVAKNLSQERLNELAADLVANAANPVSVMLVGVSKNLELVSDKNSEWVKLALRRSAAEKVLADYNSFLTSLPAKVVAAVEVSAWEDLQEACQENLTLRTSAEAELKQVGGDADTLRKKNIPDDSQQAEQVLTLCVSLLNAAAGIKMSDPWEAFVPAKKADAEAKK